jgi:hypothetical protein
MTMPGFTAEASTHARVGEFHLHQRGEDRSSAGAVTMAGPPFCPYGEHQVCVPGGLCVRLPNGHFYCPTQHCTCERFFSVE